MGNKNIRNDFWNYSFWLNFIPAKFLKRYQKGIKTQKNLKPSIFNLVSSLEKSGFVAQPLSHYGSIQTLGLRDLSGCFLVHICMFYSPYSSYFAFLCTSSIILLILLKPFSFCLLFYQHNFLQSVLQIQFDFETILNVQAIHLAQLPQ